jgi:voltage-gated potassium channel
VLLLRLIRLVRRLRARRSIGFGVAAILLAIGIFGNATTFYLFEHPVQPKLTYGDALWFSAVSITTLGYGDLIATTHGARIGTVVFIMLVGLSSFSLFFGMVLDSVSTAISKAQKGLGRAMVKDHIIIVHFPSESRVRQIIDEIRSDPEHGNSEIVIISGAIDELPFAGEDLVFVRGSSHDAETYRRADAAHCKMAIVLSPDYSDRNSDAIVAAAVSVLDRANHDMHIVAECLDEKHRPLFDSCNCDAVVLGMSIAGNLLVQEAHDPGIAQVIEAMASNRRGTTLFSVEVGEAGVSYVQLGKGLLDHGINVIAINRGPECLTTLTGVDSKPGDRIVYAATRRTEWAGLRKLADA